jgi:hypothetical protein
MQESYGKISVSEAPCGEPETARLGVRERERERERGRGRLGLQKRRGPRSNRESCFQWKNRLVS